MQMTPIKRHPQGIGMTTINRLKTQPKMWLGWVCGLCHKTRPSMGFGTNQLNSMGPSCKFELFGSFGTVRFDRVTGLTAGSGGSCPVQ